MVNNMNKKEKNKKEIKKEEIKETIKEDKEEEQKVTFDVYFQRLMQRHMKILAHHKAPMRKYAEGKSAASATEEKFNKIFESY